MKCRHCDTPLKATFLDLGTAPPSNAYLDSGDLNKPEKYFPLRVLICKSCWLVQTEDFADADELFTKDYGYFSSMSKSWLAHCERFVDSAIRRFSLNKQSMVVEIAANDGYLLQYVKQQDVPCYGVEPTHATAQAARHRGVEIIEEFFGRDVGARLFAEGRSADLTIANNVLAHVPFINDFVAGFREILKPHGVAVFEFPHLLQLVQGVQFDTIYHEHFSYLSLTAVKTIFEASGLTIFDVEELPTHGGSLRVFAQLSDTGRHAIAANVSRILDMEMTAGMASMAYYEKFQHEAESAKNAFLSYLIAAKERGLTVAAYGAAAKGNTLMNFAGVRADLLSFIVDRSPGKQGRWTPGGRIPILGEDELHTQKPDRVVILPWNLREEISQQLSYIRNWGGKFVIAIPTLEEF